MYNKNITYIQAQKQREYIYNAYTDKREIGRNRNGKFITRSINDVSY